MCSKNIFFTIGFWVGLPQNLGFDFSVRVGSGLLAVSLDPISLDPTLAARLVGATAAEAWRGGAEGKAVGRRAEWPKGRRRSPAPARTLLSRATQLTRPSLTLLPAVRRPFPCQPKLGRYRMHPRKVWWETTNPQQTRTPTPTPPRTISG